MVLCRPSSACEGNHGELRKTAEVLIALLWRVGRLTSEQHSRRQTANVPVWGKSLE
jgi:hypothetical protein